MSNLYITEPATNGKVCLVTTLGDIDIELWSRECPLACRNFIQLCLEGYYNNTIFHRLVKDFIVQGGDPTGSGHGGESIYGKPFKSEFHQRLKFNRRGLVGMAGEKKDTNGSQFFFTLGPTQELTGKHTMFGKVVGDTLFNMLKLNEYEVDKNERPSVSHKIKSAKILSNPFPDIQPREHLMESRRKKEKAEKRPVATKNTALLSFGDEAEEEEQQFVSINKKLKGKSAHDVLQDDKLSKEAAVKPEEIGGHADNEEEDNQEERLSRIRDKLKGKKRKVKFDDPDGEEDDLDKYVDEHREAEKKAELDQIATEVKQLQKEYVKALRGPKERKGDDDDKATEGMKLYKALKMKFKSGTKGVVKQIDPKREEQTMNLLDRFKTKLSRSNIEGILTDKKVDMSDQKTQEEIILATSADQGKLDLDAKDIEGDEWMHHVLVAPEDTSGVTKARDANLREQDEEWYPIDDPRNKMNIRRRLENANE
jgi:peptidyl-prolyl cis-trans isomerase SDCCAG10